MTDTAAGLNATGTAPDAPPAAAAAAALVAKDAVTVTEQHLLLAVLQSPEALQLTAQHMTVDRGSAAEEAVQHITAVVAAAADRVDAAAHSSSADLQLSPGLSAAMNRALHITRRLGKHAKHPSFCPAIIKNACSSCAATGERV